MQKLEPVVAHLPQETKKQLKYICSEKASTISQTVRLLIQNYIAENTNDDHK